MADAVLEGIQARNAALQKDNEGADEVYVATEEAAVEEAAAE